MKIKTVLLFLIFVFAVGFGCTGNNVNQAENAAPNVNIPAALKVKPRWTVVVCSSRTKNIMLSVGANERETFPFATWRETSPQKTFNMPDRVQNLTTIHFMASTTDKNPVELCILYDGKPKKRVEFDDSEDVSVNASDNDDESCRCTE